MEHKADTPGGYRFHWRTVFTNLVRTVVADLVVRQLGFWEKLPCQQK